MKCHAICISKFSLAILVSTQAATAGLIVNGSFEDPAIRLPRAWNQYASIPGWTGGAAGIEIQVDGVGDFTASGIASGEQFVELDSSMNSSMYQDVPTITGTFYTIAFAYAPRQSLAIRPVDSNDIAVLWEGNEIAYLGGPSFPDLFRKEVWKTYSLEVLATSNTGVSRLEFTARGSSDSVGGLIDRVSLTKVPETSSLAIASLAIGIVISSRYYMPSSRL